MTEPPVSFEEAEAELRRIVERLESGQVDVDEALELWERGEELYAICRRQLDVAEGKVEDLAQRVQATKPSA